MQVRALVADGYLRKSGTTRPTYGLGRNRRFERRYARQGLAEDTVWFEQLLPLLRELPRNILDIAHHGVTEMVNNAVDHSDAAWVMVRMDMRDGWLRFEIADGGIGIFRKITRALDLPEERLALLELSKGKLTIGIFSHWQLVGHAGYSQRLNQFGRYEGSTVGLELRYRFCEFRAGRCPSVR
jgi:hypothetical protein